MKRLPWMLALGLALLLVLSSWAAREAFAERDAQIDSIRSEETRLRADSMGWETRLVNATEELSTLLYQLNDSLRVLGPATDSLVRQVELLGGQVRTLSEMYVGVTGSIEAHEATVHTSAQNPAGNIPDSITAPIDDGLLSGRLVYRPPATLAIDPYRVELELVGSVAETADGRALFAARAADPRVTVRLGDVFYSPPAPVQYCGWGTRLTWTLGGAAAGALGWEIAR